MIINSGRGEGHKIYQSIKEGEIERTNEYKYLGWWFNQENTAQRQLKEIESKIDYMVKEIKSTGGKKKVGKHDGRIQGMLYEKVAVPTLTYNMETATNMTIHEYEQLEKIQAKALKKLYNLPKSTPYWGMLIELGVKPLEYIVHYKRLMLYHNIMHSSDDRVAKQILQQQKKYEFKIGFYQEICKSTTFFKIDIDVLDTMNSMKKSQWKRMIKRRMDERLNEETEKVTQEMSKLRFLRGSRFGTKAYIGRCDMQDTQHILQLKLKMMKIGCNYGKKGKCMMCNVEEESEEHMLECEEASQRLGYAYTGGGCITGEDHNELIGIYWYIQHIIEDLKRLNEEK